MSLTYGLSIGWSPSARWSTRACKPVNGLRGRVVLQCYLLNHSRKARGRSWPLVMRGRCFVSRRWTWMISCLAALKNWKWNKASVTTTVTALLGRTFLHPPAVLLGHGRFFVAVVVQSRVPCRATAWQRAAQCFSCSVSCFEQDSVQGHLQTWGSAMLGTACLHEVPRACGAIS